MVVSRRSFLKGLLATGSVAVVGNLVKNNVESLGKKTETIGELSEKFVSRKTESAPKKAKPVVPKDVQLLMESFFPILKLNEGEKFCFYLCAKDKVSVGYGTNLEANPHLYHNGQKLSMEESIKAYVQMNKMSANLAEMKKAKNKKAYKKEKKQVETKLAQYTIQPQDAKKLADKGMRYFIGQLESRFKNPKTNQSCFFDLPLCMQGLALDIMYQIGPSRFANYKKFKAALLARDFETAVKESKVYIDKEAKTVSLNRERRKKRLLRVMKIAQAHKNNPNAIPQLICQDYNATVPAVSIRTKWGIPYPYFEKALNRNPDLACELSMAQGEYCHIKLCQKKALEAIKSKATEKKVALTSQRRQTVLGKKRQTER